MISSPASAERSTSIDKSFVAVVLAGICTFLEVYNTQPLLPFLQTVFHASEAEVSLTVSATTLGIAVAAPVIGLLAESIGRRKVIVPALFGLTVPTFFAATAHTLGALLVWRFLQGLFVPGIIAVMITYIGEEWAGRGVGSMMSAYVSGTVLGGFLGRFLSAQVVTRFHWQYSFLLLGTLNLIGAVVVWRWLPPSATFKRAPGILHTVRHTGEHFLNWPLVTNFVTGFTVLFSLVGAFTSINFYLAAPPLGLGPAALGNVFFVYLLGLIVTPISGRFLDRRGFLRTATVAVAMGIAGLALTLVHSLWAIIPGLAVFSSGIFVLQSAATVQTGRLAEKARSSATGLYVTFYYVGGSCGAALLAWMYSISGWPSCVAVLITSLIATLLLARSSSRETEVVV
jgi:YNFM family putative membrane transporter